MIGDVMLVPDWSLAVLLFTPPPPPHTHTLLSPPPPLLVGLLPLPSHLEVGPPVILIPEPGSEALRAAPQRESLLVQVAVFVALQWCARAAPSLRAG